MNIILCGYHWTGCKVLSYLLKKKYNVYVFTHISDYYVNDLIHYCKTKNVPFSTEKISTGNIPFKPDVIISSYYRYIISNELIDVCQGKIFNLHPSLLPNYKGCSSLTWAMINGESKVGYTYHYISSEIDCGNIIFQEEIEIEDFDTQQSLYFKVMFESMKNFEKVFNLVINSFVGIEQKKDEGQYFRRGAPENGIINSNWSDQKVERFIRAMIFPPLKLARFNDIEIFSFDHFKSLKNGK
jgi:methionyl-tRNA formyltransferase